MSRAVATKEKAAVVEEIKRVEVDALVVLQIMKHCQQQAPAPVTGQLLGLDRGSAVEVTHSFGYISKVVEDVPYYARAAQEAQAAQSQDDAEKYRMEMLRRLRDVNVDSNIVGWYQTTHLGQFFSDTVIETQYTYQIEIPRSVLLVYDPLQARIGKPSFKALRLTAEFMKRYEETHASNKSALNDFPSGQMFVEIPISIHSPVIVEAFLLDWAIMDPMAMTQIDSLDVENQVFLENNVQLLIKSLQELGDEQQKMQMYERQAGRQQEGKGGGKGKGKNIQQPKQLDTMILSQQMQNYCKQINMSAGDAFGKVFLLSNKPAGVSKAR